MSTTLEECGKDKGPGPNGFNISFIKAGWGFLKKISIICFLNFIIGVESVDR